MRFGDNSVFMEVLGLFCAVFFFFAPIHILFYLYPIPKYVWLLKLEN